MPIIPTTGGSLKLEDVVHTDIKEGVAQVVGCVPSKFKPQERKKK
jgi:hypothetical protein